MPLEWKEVHGVESKLLIYTGSKWEEELRAFGEMDRYDGYACDVKIFTIFRPLPHGSDYILMSYLPSIQGTILGTGSVERLKYNAEQTFTRWASRAGLRQMEERDDD